MVDAIGTFVAVDGVVLVVAPAAAAVVVDERGVGVAVPPVESGVGISVACKLVGSEISESVSRWSVMSS